MMTLNGVEHLPQQQEEWMLAIVKKASTYMPISTTPKQDSYTAI